MDSKQILQYYFNKLENIKIDPNVYKKILEIFSFYENQINNIYWNHIRLMTELYEEIEKLENKEEE